MHMWEDSGFAFLVDASPELSRASAERLMADYGDGARAIVAVRWKGSKSGHVFIAEQFGDETWFIDPQTGDLDVSRYFSLAEPGRSFLVRVDDREPTDLILEAVGNKG